MFSRTKHKDKKHHCMSCLQSFTKEEILNQHKKQCLLSNGCQAVNYESGTIIYINYEKQMPIPFKIHAHTECFLKRVNSYEGEHTIKYQEHILNSIGAKLVCIDDRFTLSSIIFKGKNCINEFIVWVLQKYKWSQQIIKQHFNKKLIMANEDEEIENNPNICWKCKEELNTDKVKDHCHISGKFRGPAHNKCNINLRLPKKQPIIFHNLQGYNGHLRFKELNNFNVDIEVIPKTIDNYRNINNRTNRNITFTDSLQLYKGSLDTLASNLEDKDFKHLMSEFSAHKLEILKKKRCISL